MQVISDCANCYAPDIAFSTLQALFHRFIGIIGSIFQVKNIQGRRCWVSCLRTLTKKCQAEIRAQVWRGHTLIFVQACHPLEERSLPQHPATSFIYSCVCSFLQAFIHQTHEFRYRESGTKGFMKRGAFLGEDGASCGLNRVTPEHTLML